MDPVTPINQAVPELDLFDLTGRRHRLQDYLERVLILNFWSAECPWSERTDRALLPTLEQWGNRAALLCVAGNAHEPVELLAKTQAERRLPVVLLDPDGAAADRYGALTTPHYFVIDAGGILRYQGAFDDVTFRRREPTRSYLVDAVQAVLEGRDPDPAEVPPYGCTIVRKLT